MGWSRVCAVAVVALGALAVRASGGDPADAAKADLVRAKALLDGRTEKSVNEGAELCLKIGNADAMLLLVAVLDEDQPHFRDIVWDAIPKFTDPYARQVVAARLKASGKNARTKEWCAQALGAFGVADFVGVLKGALGSGDDLLRAAAARALGAIRDKSALDALKQRVRDDDPFARDAVIEAISRIDPAAGKGQLWEGLRDTDAGVRCALLGVVPSLYPDLAEETAATALGDADWRPRAQAVENLCAAKTKTAIDVLVRATGDGRPAVAQRAVSWLQGATGMKFTERAQWEPWWKENREKFAFGEGAKPGPAADDKGKTSASFNGLEVTSDHVVFVIDKSADMLRTLKNGKAKNAAAQAELETTLGALPAGVTFNVVTYGAKVQSFSKKAVPLDAKSRAAALKWVGGIACEGSKNIWEVVDAVVRDGTIDTAYLLSSGEPEVGLYVHWNRVCEHLAIVNRHFKVVIHGVSYTDSDWFRQQIEHVAESTGGKFTARQ